MSENGYTFFTRVDAYWEGYSDFCSGIDSCSDLVSKLDYYGDWLAGWTDAKDELDDSQEKDFENERG